MTLLFLRVPHGFLYFTAFPPPYLSPPPSLSLSPSLLLSLPVSISLTLYLSPQVRRALNQMFFASKSFNWLRHVAIAVTLLSFINMLVIFAPNILGIFGIIG